MYLVLYSFWGPFHFIIIGLLPFNILEKSSSDLETIILDAVFFAKCS